MEKWISGIPYEIAFWNSIFARQKSRNRLFLWSKFNSEIELPNFDVQKFLLAEQNPIVADAGCGMSYCTGNRLNNNEIEIIYIDPLASFYNKILAKYKPDLPKITFGFIEYLSAFFPAKNCSLIIIQNALDHCDNPLKGIFECLESLKIGGVLYLKHKPNEAETENYRGFHQYNIDIENQELVLWNKENSINVNAVISQFADIENSSHNSELVSVITKKAEVPADLQNDKNDKLLLCNDLIYALEKLNTPSFVLKYHFKFLYFRAVQFVMRFFNYSFRIKLKKIIKNFF